MAEPVLVPPTAGMLDTWMFYVLDRVATVHGLGAIAGSLLFSWIVTHFWKMSIDQAMPEPKRDRMIQRTAFVLAFGPCFLAWFMTFDWTRFVEPKYAYVVFVTGALVSVAAGAASPFLYTYVVPMLPKFGITSATRLSYSARKSEEKP